MKENLERRIAELKKQREADTANLHALGGAIQFAEELLAELNAPLPPATPNPKAAL